MLSATLRKVFCKSYADTRLSQAECALDCQAITVALCGGLYGAVALATTSIQTLDRSVQPNEVGETL